MAGTQIEYKAERRVLHLALTVAALDEQRSSGFVLVVEDTSELLRAQKAAAWHEVARRVAHEIKNPLTPIALCADRIARQLERAEQTAETRRILHECSTTIAREVESVRTLVDEFSQFTRFPAAQPVPCGSERKWWTMRSRFSRDGWMESRSKRIWRPSCLLVQDRPRTIQARGGEPGGQRRRSHAGFAAEAPLHRDARCTEADSVELIIADTGCGVSREDKEKLFLPYFSTKGRGTGLGLAIVNRILADHDATIRVEDNRSRRRPFHRGASRPDRRPKQKSETSRSAAAGVETRS